VAPAGSVYHAGCFRLAGKQRARRLALTADVVAVLAAEQVVVDDLEVFAGGETLRTEV
jgi:hypothetical protein